MNAARAAASSMATVARRDVRRLEVGLLRVTVTARGDEQVEAM
jgi:hypothetical protein